MKILQFNSYQRGAGWDGFKKSKPILASLTPLPLRDRKNPHRTK